MTDLRDYEWARWAETPEKKLSEITDYIPKSDQVSIQIITKYISRLLFSFTLHNVLWKEMKLKNNLNKILKSWVWFFRSFCCFDFVLFSLGDETTKTISNDPAQTRNAVSESLESHSVTVTGDSCINTSLEQSN